MKNRYPGKCRWCGGTVPAESDYVMGKPGAWEFSHHECVPEIKPVLEYDL